jgi:hypothetical protein
MLSNAVIRDMIDKESSIHEAVILPRRGMSQPVIAQTRGFADGTNLFKIMIDIETAWHPEKCPQFAADSV